MVDDMQRIEEEKRKNEEKNIPPSPKPEPPNGLAIIAVLLILFLIYKRNDNSQVSSEPNAKPRPTSVKKENLNYLKNFEGKYYDEVHLFDNSILEKRLKKLLGKRYAFLRENWDTTGPMELNNGIFTAAACKEHSCTITDFIIVVDIARNSVYAGVREEGEIELYSEDSSKPPKQIDDWVNK